MNTKLYYCLAFIFLSLTWSSCKDNEISLPDQLVQFEASEQGMNETDEELSIKLKLNREATEDVSLVIDLTTSGITYGTEFTTSPQASESGIQLRIPKGKSETEFIIKKASDLLLDGDESVNFKIKSVTAPVIIGSTGNLLLKFGPIISIGTTLQLNGLIGNESGSSAGNAVFVDLSNNRQTAVGRSSWDLGFSNGEEFRVIINNLTSATARLTNKTDLNQVTAADTLEAGNWSLGYTPESFNLIDDPLGDLSKTVIAGISPSDGENQVYILNPGTGGGLPVRPWWKLRILRKGNDGYLLQYARIQDQSFKTIEIKKGADHHFQYVQLSTEAKIVDFSPASSQWDFRWSYALYQTAFGTTNIPYAFFDLIAINQHSGVEAAEVMASKISYSNFTEADLAGITFENDVYKIGSNWRVTSSSTEPVGVRTDRYYLIKDTTGNIYKLRFLSFHSNDGGERGKPKFEYSLVKKNG
ncbi:HmuY family protein [Dyadobacter tibetensis]|uniref:HmuY family protein n=1 Tax=Dyadobacter tibetensis TaxID=1211851 RepID=UPI00046ED13C|nr:HmuY family protein [Dyadobacter tibetensis]